MIHRYISSGERDLPEASTSAPFCFQWQSVGFEDRYVFKKVENLPFKKKRMLNTTLFALTAAHMSLSPMFAAKQNLNIHNSRFFRFLSPLVFNSHFRISSSSFSTGLSAAIYLSNARDSAPIKQENVPADSSVVLEDLAFKNIAQSDFGAVYVDASLTTVTGSALFFSNCKISDANSVFYVSGRVVTIKDVCIVESSAKEVSGIDIKSVGDEATTLMTTTVYKCTGGTTPVRMTGNGNFMSFVNVSHCEATQACGITLIRSGANTAGNGIEHSLVQHGKGTCAVYTDVDGTFDDVLTTLGMLQILRNTVTTDGLIRLVKNVQVSNGFFVGNTMENAYFTTSSPTDSAVISHSTMDFSAVSVPGISFTSCSFDQKSIELKTFYGLNSFACVAEPEPIDIYNFFDQFSSEETISLIIVGIALFTAIVQIVVYSVIACRNRKQVQEESGEYDSSDSSEFEMSSSSD